MELFTDIHRALGCRPAHLIEPGERARAAVSLVIGDFHEGPSILFIERSTNENDDWSGHIGLPGGKVEAGDRDPRHTAERETQEELGLDLSGAFFLGRLSDSAPGGLGIVISCFVYAVNRHPLLTLDPREVADAFWFPVREFNNPARRCHVDFIFKKRLRRFPALRLVDDKAQPLWGITYRLLRNFNKVVTCAADRGR